MRELLERGEVACGVITHAGAHHCHVQTQDTKRLLAVVSSPRPPTHVTTLAGDLDGKPVAARRAVDSHDYLMSYLLSGVQTPSHRSL